MAFFGAGDIPPMLAQLGGVRIQVGADEARGHVDCVDSEMLENEAHLVGTELVATVETGVFTTIAEGVAVTVVDGPLAGAYKAARVLRIDDGAMTRVLLARS